ncbi:Methyltransferase domain, partial [Rhizoctonia solani]
MVRLVVTPPLTWSPTLYNNYVDFVYSDVSTGPLFELVSLQPGERVADMGCGTGELTLRLQQLVGEQGLVLGVDYSEEMLEVAKANGVKNLACCDLQDFVLPDRLKLLSGTFDAVFTNSALHWCSRDPRGPVRAAKSLLKPGGRFVGEFCGYMTGLGIRSAFSHVLKQRGIQLPNPWFLPQPAQYAKILESEGFVVEHVSLNPRVLPLSGSLIGFLRAVYRIGLLKDMSDEEADQIMHEVSDICQVDQKDSDGVWYNMHVTLRFRAIAPSTV